MNGEHSLVQIMTFVEILRLKKMSAMRTLTAKVSKRDFIDILHGSQTPEAGMMKVNGVHSVTQIKTLMEILRLEKMSAMRT